MQKVLHLASSFHTTKLYAELIGRLNKNFDNTVFLPLREDEKFENKYNDIKVVSVQCFKNWHRFFYRLKQRKIQKAFLKNVDAGQYDLIHSHYLFTNGYLAYKMFKKFSIPYVTAVRNIDINVFFKYRKTLKRIGIKVLINAQKIILLSPAYEEKLLKYVPNKYKQIIKNKIQIIPNGINDIWLENKNLNKSLPNDKEIKIVFSGRIEPNKNCMLVKKAVELLENKYDITYIVAGKIENEKYFDEIQKDFKQLNYVGVKKPEELVELYKSCDMFVMPSHAETFGLVYAEAMSQGLPVLYTRGEGFDGQFEEGLVGYSVSDEDSLALANTIEKVLENYSTLSKNAVKLVDKFNWNEITNKYVDIYCAILNNGEN